MNLNKNFLTEVIKYLISKGVTLADVMDTFNEHFNTSDNAIKNEHENHDEVRKPITDIDLLLCGRSVEESSTPCTTVDSNRDLSQKVKKKAENTEKPVSKSRIDYPKTVKNHGNGVSPARKALFDVVGDKTVIEHLKENGITYSNFDNRIRKNWSVAEACTTPLASWGKGKRKRIIEESEESKAVIVPDNVKVVEESSPKTKMMLVNGIMTEMKVSDTDLVQSSIIEKPAETLETKTETLETESNTEKTTESVTIEPQTETDTDTRVNDTNANSDAIRKDNIEKALKKFITSTTGIKYEESKKDKKPKEVKADLTVLEVCQKMNITTHELKEMVSAGEFPQPDCDKKWSVKLLKKEGII